MNFAPRRRGDDCLSDFFLDTLIAGDVSAERAEHARAHADDCESCRARWQQLSRRAESLPLPALTSLQTRADGKATAVVKPRRLGTMTARLRWVGAAAACAAFLLFQRLAPREASLPGERLKGGGRLGFFVQRGGEISRGGPGELLHPGDTLQLTFFAPSAGYLVVLGRDAAGVLSVYYPGTPQAAAVAAGEQTLPASTLLDGSLGEESLEAVFCTAERDVNVIRAALERNTVSELEDCTVDSLRVVKEPL